jgi:ABC-type bacteriocin/lantibiotic exporter with double-glycine peptidase domain
VAEEFSVEGSAYSVPITCKKFTISRGERIVILYDHPLFVRTMMQLLTGRTTDFNGHLSYKGRSMKSINLKQLRTEMGEVWGRDELITGTIIENIEAGRKDIPFERIEQVLNEIGLMNDIRILPEAEVTRVHPYSNLLSSTITKGILLARNLIDEPDILLVDAEQLPSDPIRHKKMLEYLLDPFHPWAVIFLSESAPDSQFFDRIYRFDKGQLTSES